mmetsp:Transcript_79613/g.140874  ORF Transcript_79613/g.140874 Transcript_79613/m.140874 type:complete len:101 (+) Transcript_79613:1701-2003(+)
MKVLFAWLLERRHWMSSDATVEEVLRTSGKRASPARGMGAHELTSSGTKTPPAPVCGLGDFNSGPANKFPYVSNRRLHLRWLLPLYYNQENLVYCVHIWQ